MNKYENMPTNYLYDMLLVNVFPVVFLSRFLIPKLLQREKKSAIINIASFAGVRPTPYVSLYSGTKAFVDFFSRSLAIEYEDKIDILSLTPLYVATKMSQRRTSRFEVISTQECVNGCLNELGYSNTSCGNWKHSLQKYLASFISESIVKSICLKTVRKIEDRKKEKNKIN